LSGFEPNVEAIAGMEPDVVLISYDPGDLEVQLEGLGIDTWTGYAAMTLDESYTQLAELGALTGHESGAATVIECMKTAISAITETVQEMQADDDVASYYYELDDTYYSVTSNTFVGQLMSSLGLVSIADGVAEGNDYPQLNIETIVSSDPDYIFLADTLCCGQTAETVATRPGWSEMTAVLENRIVELDDDIASRWGPRVVDLLTTVANAISSN
jgi:iron complex transport system substrate-binding protein